MGGSTVTIFVQIAKHGAKIQTGRGHFKPWLNCKSLEETIGLAVNKLMREAGYMNHRAEKEVHNWDVYTFTDQDPTYPSGRPMALNCQHIRMVPC